MDKKLKFAEWLALDAMAARRSFARSVGKFQRQTTKPVAILTAFRGERSLSDNRAANAQLANDLQQLNLGFYPVNGMGQEDHQTLFGLVQWVVPSSEESFVVQPRVRCRSKRLRRRYGISCIITGSSCAMMKLPSSLQAFLLKADGDPEGKGSEVGARTSNDPYYSQLKAALVLMRAC